jgi:hypothetical protein
MNLFSARANHLAYFGPYKLTGGPCTVLTGSYMSRPFLNLKLSILFTITSVG